MGADIIQKNAKMQNPATAGNIFWWHANTRSVSWKPLLTPRELTPDSRVSQPLWNKGMGMFRARVAKSPQGSDSSLGTGSKIKPRVTSEAWAPWGCRPKVSHHLILLCLNLSHSDGSAAPKHPQWLTDAAAPTFYEGLRLDVCSGRKRAKNNYF